MLTARDAVEDRVDGLEAGLTIVCVRARANLQVWGRPLAQLPFDLPEHLRSRAQIADRSDTERNRRHGESGRGRDPPTQAHGSRRT